MYPATADIVSMCFPPPPTKNMLFNAQVASKFKQKVTGQTARAWYLNAILIPFPHCHKHGLKAVPPIFSSGSVILVSE